MSRDDATPKVVVRDGLFRTNGEVAVTRVLIIGAGGQGLVVADILLHAREQGGADPIGLLDDNPSLAGSRVLGVPVLGTLARLSEVPHEAIVVAIGDNARRQEISRLLEQRGERLVTARHPQSIIALDVEVGPGCMISAGAVVAPGVRIGRGVLLNTHCSVDHHSEIDPFAHVSPGATLGGNVTIGERTLIGLGASVMPGRRVGADAVIGAGALVVHDIPDGVVVVGVPARARRADG